MRTLVPAIRLLAIALPVMLAGCVKLARESPRLQLYVLSGGPADAQSPVTVGAPSASRGAFSVGLSRIELASYLSAPSVMMRRGANQLTISEFHRWGGDLDQSINRAVAAYLAASPRVRAVDVAPWTARARHDVLVQLHVTRFEGVVVDSAATDGRVHVIAGWDIIRPFDGSVLVRGSTDDREGTFRVGDYTALVAGLDAALSRVARDIGACLAKFPNDSTPPASCGGL
jgi:uncharacterized lipoprotein YmbA